MSTEPKDREDLIKKIHMFKAGEPVEPIPDETPLFSETVEKNHELLRRTENAFSQGKLNHDTSKNHYVHIDRYQIFDEDEKFYIVEENVPESKKYTVARGRKNVKEALYLVGDKLSSWDREIKNNSSEKHVHVGFRSSEISVSEYIQGKNKGSTHLSVNPRNPSEATLSILLVKPFLKDDKFDLETSLRGVMRYSNNIDDSYVNSQDERGLLWPAIVGIEKKDEDGERRITYADGFEDQVKTSYNSSETYFNGKLGTKNIPGLTVEESKECIKLSTHSRESYFPLPLKQQAIEKKLRKSL